MRAGSSITNVWGGYGGRLPGMGDRVKVRERAVLFNGDERQRSKEDLGDKHRDPGAKSPAAEFFKGWLVELTDLSP